VPIFQEQAMRLAITLANFTPGEAEKLRRAMAAWKSHKGVIETFKEKITQGMLANGYTAEFANNCLNQIKGFSEYGFPESHAASFALLVYASAWIKRHHPAEFTCALLNSQPMGFYQPAQIIRDAQLHGVKVAPIDANASSWDCRVEYDQNKASATLRLGLRLVRGMRRSFADNLESSRLGVEPTNYESYSEAQSEQRSISKIWLTTPGATRSALTTLARADSFSSLGINRREAYWAIHNLPNTPAPLDAYLQPRSKSSTPAIPHPSEHQQMLNDYSSTGLSLRAHPIQFIRDQLRAHSVVSAESLKARYGEPVGKQVAVAGLSIVRQRPGTAKGVVFITLEDETCSVNLVIRPKLFEREHRTITLSAALIATGRLERVGELVYIDVIGIKSIDKILGSALHRG
jgi:error-prone DNA polymerase